jgi:hypothetical protein
MNVKICSVNGIDCWKNPQNSSNILTSTNINNNRITKNNIKFDDKIDFNLLNVNRMVKKLS